MLTNHRESKNAPAATGILSEPNLGVTGKFNAQLKYHQKELLRIKATFTV